MIRRTLYEVECETPHAHLFFARLASDLRPSARSALLEHPKGPIGGGLRYEFGAEHPAALTLTFEQDVTVTDWVPVAGDENTRRRETITLRHPLTVRFPSKMPLVLVSYPGYTHGNARRQERVTYEPLVSGVLAILNEVFGVRTTPAPVRACINKLDEAQSTRVVIFGARQYAEEGKFAVTSWDERISIREFLSKLIAQYMPRAEAELRDAIAKVTRNANADSMLLLWRAEEIATRVEFWNAGSEFLVFWRETDKSFRKLERIIALLNDVSEDLGDDPRSVAWQYIAGCSAGAIVVPSEIVAQLGVGADIGKAAIVHALEAGLLMPVFRLVRHAELVNEAEGAWTDNLASLARTFHISDGEDINGSDPTEIQVGFRRVRQEGALASRPA